MTAKPKYVMREKLPSGAFRYRFRDPLNGAKLTFANEPGTPGFDEEYSEFVANLGDHRAELRRREAERRTKFFDHALRRIRARAKAMGREFDLTLQDLLNMNEDQGGRCIISNVRMQYSAGSDGRRNPFAASVDRRDTSRGYVLDNVQLVCLIVNIARSDFAMEDFILACEAVARAVRI